MYVGIFLDGERVDKDIKEQMQALLSENIGKKYECTASNAKYNKVGRIYEMHFQKLDKMLQNVKTKCYNDVI